MSDLPADIQLSEKQAAFVQAFVDQGSGDYIAAAKAAGYTPSVAKTSHYRVTRSPQLLAAIHLEVSRRLQEGAPIALKVLTDLAGSAKTPEKIRLDAAKAILDRAGHIAPRARSLGDAGEKTLGEMSLDELKATQERLNSELAARAKTVSAPSGPIIDSQAIDLIG
jgi:phage terminase small subunit